jgi:hypothetical protein
MKNVFCAAVACVTLTIMFAISGFANAIPPQVTLSSGTSGNIKFVNTGSSVDVSFTGTSGQCGHSNCVGGAALLDVGNTQTNGTYTMWMTGGPISLTGGPSDYTVALGPANIWLEVKLGGNGSLGDLIAAVSLTDLTDGNTTTPQFSGDFIATIATLGFKSYFPLGNLYPGEIDFVVKLPKGSTLSPKGATVQGYLSSG